MSSTEGVMSAVMDEFGVRRCNRHFVKQRSMVMWVHSNNRLAMAKVASISNGCELKKVQNRMRRSCASFGLYLNQCAKSIESGEHRSVGRGRCKLIVKRWKRWKVSCEVLVEIVSWFRLIGACVCVCVWFHVILCVLGDEIRIAKSEREKACVCYSHLHQNDRKPQNGGEQADGREADRDSV